MVAGRPRTTSLPPKEMIKLGEEMIAWLKEHPETLHLSEWYTIEKMFIYNEWKTFLKREEFVPYYEVALKMVGAKYLDKTSNVREGISQRWQRSYFKDLKEQEDQDADDQIKRQKSLNDEKQVPREELLKLEDQNIRQENRIRELENALKSKTGN